MKVEELRIKSISDLKDHLSNLSKEHFSLRMQKGSGQLTHTHQLRVVRREIARVKMFLSEKGGRRYGQG